MSFDQHSGEVHYSVRAGCGRRDPKYNQWVIVSGESDQQATFVQDYAAVEAKTLAGREYYSVRYHLPVNYSDGTRKVEFYWKDGSDKFTVMQASVLAGLSGSRRDAIRLAFELYSRGIPFKWGGKKPQALQNYYDKAVKSVAGNVKGSSESEIRRWFGETLITPTRIRAQVSRGLLSTGGLPNKAVDQLLNVEHLIRLEETRGGKWYELSHDRFITPILDSNEKWMSKSGTIISRPARIWYEHQKDAGFLFRGRYLREAIKSYEKNKYDFGQLEVEFLNASVMAVR